MPVIYNSSSQLILLRYMGTRLIQIDSSSQTNGYLMGITMNIPWNIPWNIPFDVILLNQIDSKLSCHESIWTISHYTKYPPILKIISHLIPVIFVHPASKVGGDETCRRQRDDVLDQIPGLVMTNRTVCYRKWWFSWFTQLEHGDFPVMWMFTRGYGIWSLIGATLLFCWSNHYIHIKIVLP